MCLSNWTFEFFRKKLETMEQMLIEIKNKEKNMSQQLDDLKAAIAEEDVELADVLAVNTKVEKDLADLAAAVKAGATPEDISAQIAAIREQTASLKTGVQVLKDADDAAVPPTTPA